MLLATDGNTKLYLLEPGDNWAPLALAEGKLVIRGQKELKVLQVQ